MIKLFPQPIFHVSSDSSYCVEFCHSSAVVDMLILLIEYSDKDQPA